MTLLQVPTPVIDLAMIRGDQMDYLINFDDENGNPIDDSGATYRMTAKKHTIDADPGVFSVHASQSAPGVAMLIVAPADTASLSTATWPLEYDIRVTETGGRVTTIQRGILTVFPPISVSLP
jgi:hypothetical protein